MTGVVAIDARAALRREIGGVERVAREMAAQLRALRPDRYVVMAPRPRLAHRAGHAWEQLALPLLARRADLLYCPANLAPLASRRNAVVIHDLAALAHPEWYGGTYVAWQRLVLPTVARRARLVLTVSRFARDEIVERLGLPNDSVAVVPNGVSPAFSPAADPAAAREALGLARPYVLALATRSARKNIAALREAAASLRPLGIELVTAGGGRGYLREEETPPGRALGYVPERLLPGLYAGALALAMPSLYEGFGLPCLEAMACGTPVVAANRAALPETCGGAALLADPQDGEAFADALVRAASDDDERARLVAAGRARAAQFTWQRSAELTDAALAAQL
ncbi:MAG TPA: glycosyltransferase family 1 protein [Thermoleophilaceae bacterium]|nr:glycosyltransferase family 1 protein [Thermoleophilaceae bacterium]